jgi:hypothetical protein
MHKKSDQGRGPGFFAPYLAREAVVMEEAHDYIDDETTAVVNATTYTWVHPLGDIIDLAHV